ncbi:N-acetyltransferase [Dictyobacter vulcani]|uniref:N-acetyltransferase n=1 Tax=Dictyobacter vulcani TaxID=2607529 RepID=A0A5J4KWQ7_9CHLR|nr:GNAT family N-acetyltransferase [Dictyobacter vulcani]GER91913.1 N-acetyltransferase [Dictyobacter vulcani]
MASTFILRPVEPADQDFLWDMLYEAAAVSPAMRALGREQALAVSSVRKYLADWGERAGDMGWIAVGEDHQPLGAAWYRFFPADAPGYGFVAANIPELTISVAPEARGLGIGGALLQALSQAAAEQGCPALSLSVDRENPARRLYERYGFNDAGISTPQDSSITLIHHLL